MLFILQLCKPPSVFPLLNTVSVYIQIYSCHRRFTGCFNAALGGALVHFAEGFKHHIKSAAASLLMVSREELNIHHCRLIGHADQFAQGRVAGALLKLVLGCGLRAKAGRFQTILPVCARVPNSPSSVFACYRVAAVVPEEFYHYFAFILSP